MIFSELEIERLHKEIEGRLSQRRFVHTLGVERAAVKIGEKCLGGDLTELRCAALLHDVTKEYGHDRQITLMREYGGFCDDDYMSCAVYHSFTAPIVIEREFQSFNTEAIRSAVLNHTLGDPDMSVFDEIIFISDYVEEGRSYPSSIDVRNKLYDSLECANDMEECRFRLHEATVDALDATLLHLLNNHAFIHPRAIKTRNAFLARLPMAL
jgi:predicted HD superfamily hydrolase involved in NAD metabolism